MANSEQWINQQVLKSQLLEKKELVDRNMRSYLVLRLEKLDGVFVFASQVPEVRWEQLVEGQEYTFTIGENSKGYLNLVDFS